MRGLGEEENIQGATDAFLPFIDNLETPDVCKAKHPRNPPSLLEFVTRQFPVSQ